MKTKKRKMESLLEQRGQRRKKVRRVDLQMSHLTVRMRKRRRRMERR
jgi:hypothetical protein